MDPLPPIPVPFSVRWREFRTRILPMFATLSVAAGAAWIWIQAGQTRDFAGVAEGVRSAVTSPQGGSLEQLLVQPFQIVQAGDPVAVLVPGDPRTALNLLQTELQLARLSLEPSMPEQNALDYERLRFELLRTKAELATATVELLRAENQVKRQTPLLDEKLVSEDLFDLTAKTRDSVAADVLAKSNAVVQMEQRLEELRPLGELHKHGNDPVHHLLEGFSARHRAMLTNCGPLTLRAPIAGMVSAVQRQPGEHVVEGEPILYINGMRADRVIGYLRQPYTIEPEIGMQAILTTRERKRRRYSGTVSQVGAQVEFITNSLAYLRPGALVDAGLPVAIDLPPGVDIRPGELVDIQLKETAPPSTAVSFAHEWAARASGRQPPPAKEEPAR